MGLTSGFALTLIQTITRRTGFQSHHLLFLIICGLFLFLTACGQDRTDRPKQRTQSLEIQYERLAADKRALEQRCAALEDKLNLLIAEHENSEIQKDELRRWNRELVGACGPSVWKLGVYEYPLPYKFYKKATAAQLLSELNELLRSQRLPEAELTNVNNAVAFVNIPQETMLTQQMGTTGARSYLNAVAYTLCSIESINCVQFEFKTGDHAMPGRLCP